MDKTALRHAWENLHAAQSAHAALVRAKTFIEVERSWAAFLLALGTGFNKLEKGSKGNRVSDAWFGRIKHERRCDPLLSYLRHARNAAEHGIKDITARNHGGISIGPPAGTVIGPDGYDIRFDEIILKAGRLRMKLAADTKPFRIELTPPKVELAPVFDDRSNKTFDPPATHLGEPLRGGSVAEVATLALEYFDRLLRDAGKLAA